MTGSLRNQYEYDAFGLRTPLATAMNGSSKHYGYTGEETDDETGLIYLRARYYDPGLGRFISADPFWGRLEEPASQNRYVYVQNNPLLYTDPSGLASFNWGTAGKSVVGVIGGGLEVVGGSTLIYFGVVTAPAGVGFIAITGGSILVPKGGYEVIQNSRNFVEAITGGRGYVSTDYFADYAESIGLERDTGAAFTDVVETIDLIYPPSTTRDVVEKTIDFYQYTDDFLQNSSMKICK